MEKDIVIISNSCLGKDIYSRFSNNENEYNNPFMDTLIPEDSHF